MKPIVRTTKRGLDFRAHGKRTSHFFSYYLSLQVFLCAGNPVRYIHPDAFKGLLVLQHLRLRSSQLQQLPSLLHIGHSLLYFELIRSMQVKENQARDCSYLRKIERIAMVHGVLKWTPLGLNHIANTVKDLELCSNGIRSIASMEGVKFIRLRRIYLYDNSITYLRPEFLLTPHLQLLNLERNKLVSLEEVTQYSWGSSLPNNKYLTIYLRQNHWHCNGSLSWMFSNLVEFKGNTIYAMPTLKPCVEYVEQIFFKSSATRRGTTVVPKDIIENVDISVRSLSDLVGKWHRNFASHLTFVNTLRSWKMATIVWTTYLNAFYWTKMYKFRLRLCWICSQWTN